MFGDLFQLICQAAIRAFPPHPRQAILKRFHNGFRFRLTRLPGEFGCEMLARGISYIQRHRYSIDKKLHGLLNFTFATDHTPSYLFATPLPG